MTTILTLELDPQSQSRFEALRQQHYPRALNQIPAHLTLFHKLPQDVVSAVHRAADRPPFTLRVTGLRSLGRGIAFTIESHELSSLHAQLAESFSTHLTAQDRQPFKPHIVIQNKATPEQARELKLTLEQSFEPFPVTAAGLTLWNYLGGPWERVVTCAFSAQRSTPHEVAPARR